MDPVEVQASVWTVGWAAASWAARLHALLSDAVPVPPAPQTPAARLRDAADHVEMTTRRVRRYLDERHGGFQHDPDWGFHGAFGSARVFVDVLPVLDDSTAVRASAPVLSDIDLSDGLAVKVAEVTAETPFGAFAYLAGRRELWFQHAILGDDLDRSSSRRRSGWSPRWRTGGTIASRRSSAACATPTSAERPFPRPGELRPRQIRSKTEHEAAPQGLHVPADAIPGVPHRARKKPHRQVSALGGVDI